MIKGISSVRIIIDEELIYYLNKINFNHELLIALEVVKPFFIKGKIKK